MPSDDAIRLLGSWEGYRVGLVDRRPPEKEGLPHQVWVELVREPSPFVYSGCGRRCKKYHDVTERWIRKEKGDRAK